MFQTLNLALSICYLIIAVNLMSFYYLHVLDKGKKKISGRLIICPTYLEYGKTRTRPDLRVHVPNQHTNGS